MNISQFLLDSACTPVTSAQEKDIIVYFNASGTVPLHSGVVYSVSSSGELTICSKWGQAGAYMHAVGNVPTDYWADLSTGTILFALFRYHDYVYSYTGNEYHSGSFHHYQYADVCQVCKKTTNVTWVEKPCTGPVCSLPWSLKVKHEVL